MKPAKISHEEQSVQDDAAGWPPEADGGENHLREIIQHQWVLLVIPTGQDRWVGGWGESASSGKQDEREKKSSTKQWKIMMKIFH